MEEVAKGLGLAGQSSYQRYERDDYDRALRLETAAKLGRLFAGRGNPPIAEEEVYALGIEAIRLSAAMSGRGSTHGALTVIPPNQPIPNGVLGGPAPVAAWRIPVYGSAIGGAHGEFVLNGNKVDDVLAPPMLQGIPDAYAVYVVGESMEPRFETGETVFVHPRLPVRRGDYVVVQIASEEGSPPSAYVKRFVNMDAERLRLDQFNPTEQMEFDRADVVSVHKIVMSGVGL